MPEWGTVYCYRKEGRLTKRLNNMRDSIYNEEWTSQSANSILPNSHDILTGLHIEMPPLLNKLQLELIPSPSEYHIRVAFPRM